MAHCRPPTSMTSDARLPARLPRSLITVAGRRPGGGRPNRRALGEGIARRPPGGPLRRRPGLFATAGHGGVDKGATSTRDGVTLQAGGGTVTVALDGAPHPQSLSVTVATEDVESRVDLTLSGYDIPPPQVSAP